VVTEAEGRACRADPNYQKALTKKKKSKPTLRLLGIPCSTLDSYSFLLPKMAGGVKKPINVFKLKNLGEPEQIFNWRLWFAVLSFGLLGAARGIDEGLITGAFNSKHFQSTINYSSYSDVEKTNIKANVSAMVQIGSVAGALL
jgi:hypothetical protein